MLSIEAVDNESTQLDELGGSLYRMNLDQVVFLPDRYCREI